jgi:hypothetical protein
MALGPIQEGTQLENDSRKADNATENYLDRAASIAIATGPEDPDSLARCRLCDYVNETSATACHLCTSTNWKSR